MKLLSLILVFTGLIAKAQTIGNFTLTNVIDNKQISLSSYTSSPGVVIIFTSIECPFDRYYGNRIQMLAADFGSRIPVLLINSHTDNEESVEAMKKHAVQEKLTLPYLSDKDQLVLNQFNARKSPEAFLVKVTAGKFTIVYQGAIDDNAQSADDVIHTYLKNAIDQLLAGQKIQVAETRPVGCNIRRN